MVHNLSRYGRGLCSKSFCKGCSIYIKILSISYWNVLIVSVRVFRYPLNSFLCFISITNGIIGKGSYLCFSSIYITLFCDEFFNILVYISHYQLPPSVFMVTSTTLPLSSLVTVILCSLKAYCLNFICIINLKTSVLRSLSAIS